MQILSLLLRLLYGALVTDPVIVKESVLTSYFSDAAKGWTAHATDSVLSNRTIGATEDLDLSTGSTDMDEDTPSASVATAAFNEAGATKVQKDIANIDKVSFEINGVRLTTAALTAATAGTTDAKDVADDIQGKMRTAINNYKFM